MNPWMLEKTLRRRTNRKDPIVFRLPVLLGPIAPGSSRQGSGNFLRRIPQSYTFCYLVLSLTTI